MKQIFLYWIRSIFSCTRLQTLHSNFFQVSRVLKIRPHLCQYALKKTVKSDWFCHNLTLETQNFSNLIIPQLKKINLLDLKGYKKDPKRPLEMQPPYYSAFKSLIVLQPDQIYIAVLFQYLVKRDASVRYCTVMYTG